MNCPCCDAPLDYVLHNDTHIWVYVECPVVMLELYSEDDLDNLKELLGETIDYDE